MDTNLSRAECARRSADITLFGYRVELDVSEAVDPDQATFPTTSIIDLTSASGQITLDFIGEVNSAMKVADPSSSTALMICTQVVAVMPPNST